MTADFYLQLENFSPAQVFENRLAAAMAGAPLESRGKYASLAQPMLTAVADATPTPGGGSVSALAGALAASLGQMVAGLSRRKKSQAAYVADLSAAHEALHKAARELTEAVDRDAASYDAVLAAMRLPKETPEERRAREEAILAATKHAAEVPLEVAELALEVYDRLGQLAAISAASMSSDLRVARLMAAAAVRGALANVEVNLESLADSDDAASMRQRMARLESRLADSPVRT
jgi:glutamate formiminotransferase/formiminotetrahydrofolate cyclodeaminase